MQILDPRQQSETYIEDKVVEWALSKDFLCPKVKFSERGWPDRLFISPFGHTIFIEFKRLGGEPDKLQAERLRRLTSRGIPAVCCDGILAAIRVLQASLEPASLPTKSDQPPVVTSISRALHGPWAGKDIHRVGCPEDIKGKEPSGTVFDNSSSQGVSERVAGGDPKVEGVRGSIFPDSTWFEEGRWPGEQGGHPPDKS